MHRHPLLAPRGPPSLPTAGHNGGDAGHGFAPEAQDGIRERGDAKNRLLGGSVYPEPSRGNPIPASPPSPIPTVPGTHRTPLRSYPITRIPFYPAVSETSSLAGNSAGES